MEAAKTVVNAAAKQKPGYLYLLRHRNGPVIVNDTNTVTDKLIRKQLPPTRVPKASRVHDWSLLCVARTPDEYSAFALKFYVHELRRKRERLYDENKALAHEWFRFKFPKRHAGTFEAVSDLANGLEYLYKQPGNESPVRVPLRKTSATQPIDVRRPSGETTVFWLHDWFKGKEELWDHRVVHKRLPVVGLGGKIEQAIKELEQSEQVQHQDEHHNVHIDT
ncbi:hypothetical protein V1525DRAFT_459090 [Lipomyces kononenkoae]|uniref:Uncharacterized protein n=1 Tax=Lipomyces kononenkoae TaxID=34357 RepID=A0ACC3SUM4_LIPKO